MHTAGLTDNVEGKRGTSKKEREATNTMWCLSEGGANDVI